MASPTDSTTATGTGGVGLVNDDDPFRSWRDLQEPADTLIAPAAPVPDVSTDAPSVPSVDDLRALADLDDPRLILSEGYVGVDRRRPGAWWRFARVTYVSRRTLFRLEILIVLAAVAALIGATLLATSRPQPTARPAVTAASLPLHPLTALAQAAPVATTAPPTTAPPTTVPSTTVPPASSASPASAPPAAPAPVTPAAAPVVDTSSPQAMGAAALALVRYPWQSLPGYSIQFLPISAAPSAGFYGNTNFTWGQSGGVSTLYVYPGETIAQLAGITAFEIGHEVDASAVEPAGGHDQIAAILGVQPASWAPQCDCAEQGYLSGWYAAAFSDYWSPGVGSWSTLAPPPSGAVLAAVQPWLNPRIP